MKTLKELMGEVMVELEWADFYVDTIEYDFTQELTRVSKPRQETVDHSYDFCTLMGKITNEGPNGTEDRIYCRTYAALRSVKEYENYVDKKDLDRYGIATALDQFNKVMV